MSDRLMVYNTITGHINQDTPCSCDNCRVALNDRQDILPVPAWNQFIEPEDVSERHAPASNPFAEPLRYVEHVPRSELDDYLPLPVMNWDEGESHPEPQATFNTFSWPGEGQHSARNKAADAPNAETLMPYDPDAMQWVDSGAPGF